ncbi:UNVERIFIED_CONTAM: hypothetical protein Sindi_1942500 [Sesamum indicum]
MWLAAVRDKNKGRLFSLGSEHHVSSRIFTPPSPPPNLVMEDRIGHLETITTDMMDMMREMWVSSSTAAPPPTNPPAENQNADEECLD